MAAAPPSSSSSFSSLNNSRPPDDTVFYSIYPDSAINPTTNTAAATTELQALHLQILDHISPLTSPYIWQHKPFSLSITLTPFPHLSGHLRYGDNLEDEWFVVYLLFEISKTFPNLSISVHDSDGEFLLIESAFHLPKWVNPDTSINRVFIRRGYLHIVPKSIFPSTPKLDDSLRYLVSCDNDNSLSRAPDGVQLHLMKKIGEYPKRAYRNVHSVRVRVPVSIAWVLRHEPCLVSLAVEAFYDRDVDSMKYAAKMERFLPRGKEEEMVEVVVRMSRAMYAQLVQQKFRAPSCFPMDERVGNVGKHMEAELGMKIACGFEMMYQMRKKQGEEGKGGAWEAYREIFERGDYFKGLLPGSKEYKRLMENVEGYYRNASNHVRVSEVLSSPVKRIDEILALPHSANDFENQDLPPSDDDSWLYGGEDELNTVLEERQKEMELYDLKHKKKTKAKEERDGGSTSGKDFDEYDLGGIAKSMQAFVEKMSSYEGAEVPDDRDMNDVDFDADQFMKDLETVMGPRGSRDNDSDLDVEEGSSSDLDFDDNEDENEDSEDIEEGGDEFMHSYSDVLNKELKATTLNKTFVHANEETSKKKDEGTSSVNEEMDEFAPLDVDLNLVKNLLDSYSSQEGLAGPASNLLGLMGLRLPEDTAKGK